MNANQPLLILGLDPGLRRTGWGVVAVEGARLTRRELPGRGLRRLRRQDFLATNPHEKHEHPQPGARMRETAPPVRAFRVGSWLKRTALPLRGPGVQSAAIPPRPKAQLRPCER